MRRIWYSARRAITVLIYLVGIGLPVISSAEQFRCRVVDQIVVAADQGRSSRYSGFVDGINVDETLDYIARLRTAAVVLEREAADIKALAYEEETALRRSLPRPCR